MLRIGRLVAGFAHWTLWCLCILLLIPLLLNVPGNPSFWALSFYLAAFGAVASYIFLPPAFITLRRNARQRADPRGIRASTVGIWVSFTVTAGIIALGASIIYANSPSPSTEDALIRQRYSMAINNHDLDALTGLVESGTDIEFKTFNNSTPVLDAAGAAAWPLVVYLLEKGADPDYEDNMGWTTRSLYKRSTPPAGDDAMAQAYRKVGTMLGETVPSGQNASDPSSRE